MIDLKKDLKVFFQDLDESDHAELLAVLLFLMSQREDLFSSLHSVFDVEEIYKLVLLYGGTKITVPTLSEFNGTLHTFMAYYYRDIKKESWEKIVKRFPFINPKKEAMNIFRLKERLFSLDMDNLRKLKDILRF